DPPSWPEYPGSARRLPPASPSHPAASNNYEDKQPMIAGPTRELVRAVLLHLPPTDVAPLLLVSRRIRHRFILSPDEHNLARKHLQHHGTLDSYRLYSRRHDPSFFHRLPLAYSLAYLSWMGPPANSKEPLLFVFSDIVQDNVHLKAWEDGGSERWEKPLRYPLRVDKLLRKAVELDRRMIIGSGSQMSFVFQLVGKLDSVELTEARVRAAVRRSLKKSGTTVARHLLSVSSIDLRNGQYNSMFPLHTLALSNHVNFNGKTPLQWALEKKTTSQQRSRSGFSSTEPTPRLKNGPLYHAVFKRNVALAEALLAKGSPVNVKFERELEHDDEQRQDCNTLLHLAVCSQNRDMVRLLIANGAAIDEADEWDLRPLHYAVCYNDHEIFDLLLSSGADPFAPGSQKPRLPVLHFAGAAGRLNMVQHLYAMDAVTSRVFEGARNGTTLLMYTAFHFRVEVVRWLLEHGGWARACQRDGCHRQHGVEVCVAGWEGSC
ncbi:hypothetical protein HDU96_009852, partial [Phlyctochytrium bullatum]